MALVQMAWGWPSVSDIVGVVTAPVRLTGGVVSTIGKTAINTAGGVVGAGVNAVGNVHTGIIRAVGNSAGAAFDAAQGLGQKINPGAPPLPPLPPPSDSNLPLILGAGAAGVLLLVLLLRRPASVAS